MSSSIDNEITNASDAIDEALGRMNKDNRGETSRNILKSLRDINDNIALKIWSDLYPVSPMGVNKAAQQFKQIKSYRCICKFDRALQKSISHFTPSTDGAERLMIKYYRYLIELKEIMFTKYNIVILKNIDCFLENIDEQTKDYYSKVANAIISDKRSYENFDNYYINRTRPFFYQHHIYFEVTLEPAEEKPNKFNRITAFTKFEINTNYAVALKFVDENIDIFGVKFPIKIITEWQVSIRPCEINNFARIFKYNINIQRSNNEYKTLMDALKEEELSLVELIDSEDDYYNKIKLYVNNSTKENRSKIFIILDNCREISNKNYAGKNILRYLLNTMNNRIIKAQWPQYDNKTYANYFLSSKCIPFDNNPFSFNPCEVKTDFYNAIECIDTKGREQELLAKYIIDNAENNVSLFTNLADLLMFGDETTIKNYIQTYNNELYDGFKPNAELSMYDKYVYNTGHALTTINIINRLKNLSNESSNYSLYFTTQKVEELKTLEPKNRLDDIAKENILINMFLDSRIHLVYGAAGTGKSTLINHVSKLMTDTRRIFLAKTNPAVENLRHKVVDKCDLDEFITIDKFTRNWHYEGVNYDLIVIDECSTVKNEEISKILNMLGNGILLLTGDIHQIEAIGFGNWFDIVKNIIPPHCCSELSIPFRSSDEQLKELWKEVRVMSQDNLVLENMVKNNYSHMIDNSIFNKKSSDEIILCLNYNGLYGLNNINKLLQLGNPNCAVKIGIWQFKIGDPILFNDSERFKVLYNNLKGKIINIKDNESNVEFVIKVDIALTNEDVELCQGLQLLNSENDISTIAFSISRRPPYFYDNEPTTNYHIIPFQIAYAVSIHKSQGLEYDSVKIVISNDSEEKITHNIFYTAITRAKKELTIYWSPEVCNRVLNKIKPHDDNRDFNILNAIYKIII